MTEAAGSHMHHIGPYLTANTDVTDELLNVVAHLPTAALASVADDGFFGRLDDGACMRLAVMLARKSLAEGGCPIGAVIVDSTTRRIVGKGHNTLVQDNDPYNHGETAAIRDAGRVDFSRTTLYTTLSPCDVCANLIHLRGFRRLVVGDVTNASGNESWLRGHGVRVDVLEHREGIELYRGYRAQSPALDAEDWKGLAFARTRRRE